MNIYSPGIHQQSMNHSEPYDFSNTQMQPPHLAYHLNPSFQCKAFVSHDSNPHADHPIKRQAIPKERNPLIREHTTIIKRLNSNFVDNLKQLKAVTEQKFKQSSNFL